MEILFVILGFVVLVGIVTVLGHVFWLFLAFVFKALLGGSREAPTGQSSKAAADRQRCPQCGRLILPWHEHCRACGLERDAAAAEDLSNLRVTEQQLRLFLEAQDIDREVYERLQSCIAARRARLTGKTPVPEGEPVASVKADRPEKELAPSLARRLERLLESSPNVRQLTPGQRQNALACHRQLSEDQLATLSARAQWTLARLLRGSEREGPAAACRAYRRLLEAHPTTTEYAAAALEAGRFARDHEQTEEARWFLNQALTKDLAPAGREEVERLLHDLIVPSVEEIPEVIPVLAAVAAEPAPASVYSLAEPPPAAPAPRPARRRTAPPLEPTPPPRPPRRSLADVLGAFMEDRNIFWGELVGGLLMVGCSIALVIYLWKEIEKIPYFQFLIFVGTTSAIFMVGVYALRRLKLETTSRGLLVIATLLVPLNFLVMAATAQGDSDLVLRLSSEAGSLAIFAYLMSLAAGALVPSARWQLIFAVLGTSLSQLAVRRLLPELGTGLEHPGLLLLLGCLPVGCYLFCAGFAYAPLNRKLREARQVNGVFTFLGMALFPLLVALGFLVYWSGSLGGAVQLLAPLVVLTSLPILVSGLQIHQFLGEAALPAEPAAEGIAPEGSRLTIPGSAAQRTAGTGLALLGMVVMLGALVLAWPEPLSILAVCVLNFVILTTVAYRSRLPVAHAPALLCLVLGYEIAFHLLTGRLAISGVAGEQLVSVLTTAGSGSALVAVVVLLGAGAELLVRTDRRTHATYYAAATGLVALVSLALVNLRGVEDPGTATLITGLYAAGSLAMNMRWRRPAVTYGGLALIAATIAWGLWWNQPALTPLWGTTLAAEALLLAGLGAWASRWEPEMPLSQAFTLRAWRDMSAAVGALALVLSLSVLDRSGLHTATAALLAATAFVLAWSYRAVPLAWIGSGLLWAGLGHLLSWSLPDANLSQPGLNAALLHATLVLLASWEFILYRKAGAEDISAARLDLQHLFAVPLYQSALVSSTVALLWQGLLTSAGDLAWGEHALFAGWLAGVWLLLAVRARWRVLFSLGQLELAWAVVVGIAQWAKNYDLGDAPTLQSCGIGLALLSLLWLAARFGLRSRPAAQYLLETHWPAVDRALLYGVVICQFLLAALGIAPGVVRELTPAGQALALAPHDACGPAAFLLLAALAAVLTVALWERRRAHAAIYLLVVALTLPILIAGPFETELTTASALRWGLALGFVVYSIPLWMRQRVLGWAERLGCLPEESAALPVYARWMLLLLAVAPVLALTTAVAVMGFEGHTPSGPVAGSFFAQLGWTASNITPLVIIVGALVGHSLRERSPGYAFAAGLLLDVAVMGGYALAIVTTGQSLGQAEWVRLLQLGTLTASVWTLLWLASRRWVAAWREEPSNSLAAPLMTLQLLLCAAGNGWLLLNALGSLVLFFPQQSLWTAEVGSPLGWIALVAAAAGSLWRLRQQQGHLNPYSPGLIGLALVGMLACSVASVWSESSYRVLMIGWAVHTPALVALTWYAERFRLGQIQRSQESPEAAEQPARLSSLLADLLTPQATALWVRVTGLLVIFLGLKAAIAHQDHLWAAAAIGLASAAGAAMAVWQRREDWAFLAGLGVNLAASLVVWHFHVDDPTGWWVALIQANAIAASAVSLLWLGVRKRVYVGQELSLAATPLLAGQIGLTLAGNMLLLVRPLAVLVIQPSEPLADDLLAVGGPAGWLALLAALAALCWYAAQAAPRMLAHTLAGSGLALGILAAVSAAIGQEPGSWLAFHVMMATWTGTAALILFSPALAQLRGGELDQVSSLPLLARHVKFTPAQLHGWLHGIGLALLVLALRGTWQDPQRPYWSAGVTLAVSIMAGALALKSPRPLYVYVSGLLINAVGSIVWVAWSYAAPDAAMPPPYSFGFTQSLCFALAGGIWLGVELLRQGRGLGPTLRGGVIPFTHLAATLATCLVAILAGSAIASDLFGGSLHDEGALPWVALAALLATLTLSLWDREAGFNLGCLYAAGAATIGLTLHTANLESGQLGRMAGILFAAYVLATTALAWFVVHAPGVRLSLHLPDRTRAWPEAWFAPVQTVVSCGVAALSIWMTLTLSTPLERLTGGLSAVLLVAAGVVLAESGLGRWSRDFRYVSLCLGVLATVEGGWAFLEPDWLNRSVLLTTALALMTLVYGVGMVRLLPQGNTWSVCGRRLGPVLGLLASVMLVVVIAQEGLLYQKDLNKTPMNIWAKLVVLACLLGTMAAAVSFAVVPGRDPFGLSESGRKLYVYATEVLLLLLFVHARLTIPELFRGQLGQYWPFIVMVIAFAGVGLSEYFQRKGMPVLADPLRRTGIFLPIVPLLAFWVHPPVALYEFLVDHFPGSRPLMEYLMKLEQHYDRYALLWFLLGLLYTVLAVTKRSYRFAALAALAANFSLWALLVHNNLQFLTHPQMWLIPFALILLVAEQLNRDRLSPQQSAALRYAALLMIYVSSTADMFIAGLGTSVVWPLLLAVLSIVGVLAGILLRVRAFLYLGVSFLFLVIFTMIWHAAVGKGQMWVWWVSGIVLGAAIISLFAIFEKRRNDVVRVLGEIRKWR
jgi:hypothetical protein